jgi:hypothetical protein
VSLADEYEALEAPRRKCKICDWYLEQTDEDQAFFDKMKVGNKVRLLTACTAMGLDAEITTLRHHINGNHEPHGLTPTESSQ